MTAPQAAPQSGAVVPTAIVPDAVLPTRDALDVADLPDVAFGPSDLMWWGTLGFVAIEGFTLALAAAVYLYLWKNFNAWPPAGTGLPALGVPTAQVVVMLCSLPLMAWLRGAAHRFDFARVRLGLAAATAFMAAFVTLRAFELLDSLNVKWDTNAYGSAAWLVVGSHATLLAVEFVEIAGMALLFWTGAAEEKHCSDVSDAAFYWYFMVLAWVPLYVLCFWGPRWT